VTKSISDKNPARRGLWLRFVSMALGLVIAGALIIGMQLPLLNRLSTSQVFTDALRSAQPKTSLAWPSVGSAAVVIPSLGVRRAWRDEVLPIASLTKLMTAFVTLKKLPLALGQTGPCVTITNDDVATYEAMKLSDQSSVLVSEGESLCEVDLLNGLLVHSASNYATLLATMVSGSTDNFVALMNRTASLLGLKGTHYADASGFDDGSVSTALDQGELAALLMKSPLVRQIVDQTSVTLPVAGNVGSFTPYVGVDNVIGVKSGRTAEAGGCDVMAMTFQVGSSTRIVYAVVLGQRGGNLLGPAGDAALALAQSAVQSDHVYTLQAGSPYGAIGWGESASTSPVGLAQPVQFSWWTARGAISMSVHLQNFTGTIRRGQRVGWLRVRANSTHRFALVVERTISPLTLWQRLR
jgi:D-alanyl-D-alanine carboxypeptidase (penicillin-binding protein 5/6)